MAGTVLGVGTGVFLVVLCWIIALVLTMILLRATGPTKLGVIPVFLLALVATLILVFFPRSSEALSPFKDMEIVDTFFIGRYVLLSVASVGFLVALFGLLPLHFLEAVYAKPLKTH
ncbi:transmembrane protein 218 [Esox lucius]|uniref:Transmembrane protein 218 n=1 Tax=Esox lucius TaxID=8010 RepID=A0AAY5LAJ5_ESOLU|nr:transmembrane protein 218 [Esox lucius]